MLPTMLAHARASGGKARRALAVVLGVVTGQKVLAPIVGEVPPDGMDMVGAVLGIVVLDQERRALDGVVVPLARLFPTGPGEGDWLEAGPLDLLPLVGGDLGGRPPDVVPNN